MNNSPSEWYLKKIEQERRLKVPTCFFTEEGLKQLDRVINSRNPTLYAFFYRDFAKYIGLEPFLSIEKKLVQARIVSEKDCQLLARLAEIKKDDPSWYFDFVGTLYNVSVLVDELKKNEELPKIIRVSLFQYIFVIMVEFATRYFSDITLAYIETAKKEKEFTEFIKKFDDGEHPTLGSVLTTMRRLGFPIDEKESIFFKNKILRNKISHGNMYYDPQSNKLYFSNGREFTMEEFREAFEKLMNLLIEYVYQYNNGKTEIRENIEKLLNKISHYFIKVGRSGNLKRALQTVIFEWEK